MSRRATSKEKTRPTAVAAAAAVGSLKKHSRAKSSDKSSRTEDQERRIIAALRRRPHTTDEFRALGIFQISARIWGLRSKGFQISTARVTVVDRDGFGHPRAALYSLVSEPERAGR